MVLIESERRLEELHEHLTLKEQHLKAQGGHLSDVETRIRDLAAQARGYLRFQYDSSLVKEVIDKLPRPSTANITNGVGSGISQFAYAGALGPDFPAAANILAINQRWVADTLHQGAPRRAWEKAGSTQMILRALRRDADAYLTIRLNSAKHQLYRPGASGQPDQQLSGAIKQPMVAYLIGHLASIATHVLVEPFILGWTWGADGRDRTRFQVQVDARLAQAYFQRSDLHTGQSWTDYFLEDSYGLELITDVLLDAFTNVYGAEPSEILCDLPGQQTLGTLFPKLAEELKLHTNLADNLAHYSGYHNLYSGISDPERFLLKEDLEQVGLDTYLRGALVFKGEWFYDGFEGMTPELKQDFLVDGYKNTVHWALDAGYDHSPLASFYRVGVSLAIWIGATAWFGANLPIPFLGSVWQVWSNAAGFSAPLGDWSLFGSSGLKQAFDALKSDYQQRWQDHGFFGNEVMWFDTVDSCTTLGGTLVVVLSAILEGISFIDFDGLFNQGADAPDEPTWKKVYVGLNDLIYPVSAFILNNYLPSFMRNPWVRWINWVLGAAADVFEAVRVTRSDTVKGVQGDQLALPLYVLKLWMALFYALGVVLALGLKSGRHDADGKRETESNVWDYMLGSVFPLVLIGWQVWGTGAFDIQLIKRVTGCDWPSPDTDLVDALLPMSTDDHGNHTFEPAKATRMPVQLFPNTDAVFRSAGDRKYYPQDDGAAFGERAVRDTALRKQLSAPSTETYNLKDLFDRAADLTALLSMAAINYDQATDKDTARRATEEIFADWNLNYRSLNEWNALMASGADGSGQTGLLVTAQQWWDDIRADREPAAAATTRISRALGLRGAPSGSASSTTIGLTLQYEDGAPMARADFEAVFGDQHVSGTTDANGAASIAPPNGAGDSFRVFLKTYLQETIVDPHAA
jgi:hypothetical protein